MHVSDVLHALVDQARFGADTFDDQYGKLNAHAAIDAASAASNWPEADHIEPAEPKAQAFPVQTAAIDYEKLAALVAQNLQHGQAPPTPATVTADGTVLSVTPPSVG